jgi:hypothetical protein
MELTLCNLDTAKLAKEKSFNIKVLAYFNIKNDIVYQKRWDVSATNFNATNYYEELDGIFYSRPTLALLQKWLIEVKYIGVYVLPYRQNECFEVIVNNITYSGFKSYDEALERGLQEGLKLLP